MLLIQRPRWRIGFSRITAGLAHLIGTIIADRLRLWRCRGVKCR